MLYVSMCINVGIFKYTHTYTYLHTDRGGAIVLPLGCLLSLIYTCMYICMYVLCKYVYMCVYICIYISCRR